MTRKDKVIGKEPLWYKDAIIYEVHVKSFLDKTGDGIGDFKGLIEKLDYLESLGVTAIWLLPFYPSPLRDDGYDIADYYNIHADYGSLKDFRKFLKESHRRGMRVITELVINHTSDQHPWFQRARNSNPNSVWRNFYVWSDKPDKYSDARIIFKDFESSNWSWDPVAQAYYWHRFYSHQPDLNYDNKRVQKEIFKVLDFWFGMGVDGLRLDAVPYLFQREATNCENLPETHEFLKILRKHVDSKFEDKMLLAEANQWPEDAAAYFGEGDECHMAFHFPVMPRLFMALRMEDRFPVIDILDQTPEIPENCQWAMFLRNHDELTLEMVTDEERDYMYRVFAQDPRARINLGIRRRLAPLLDNNRRKMELMNIILFSMPGTPVIYYGDEIGMGDNYYLGDRDGVRTPMQWSADRNAGFSRSNPQKLYLPVIIDPEYHFESLNVDNQNQNPSSLLWWMKRVIAMRKQYKAFSRGSIEFLFSDNPKVLTFVRRYENEVILIAINLSRFTQVTEIDLSEFAGNVPEELFSQNKFPVIREQPYLLILGPHGHYWLILETEESAAILAEERSIPEIRVNENWMNVLENDNKNKLEKQILPEYLPTCRWFGGKARNIRRVAIKEKITFPKNGISSVILIVEVQYKIGASDAYLMPLSFASIDEMGSITEDTRGIVIAYLITGGKEGILYESIYSPNFRSDVLSMIFQRKRLKGAQGELLTTQGKLLRSVLKEYDKESGSRVLKAEQSNSSFLYGNTFFMKMYRRIEEGMNPDPEVLKFLTENTKFRNVPVYLGSLEYKKPNSDPIVFSFLQAFEPNEGDAWILTKDALSRFYERVLSEKSEAKDLDIKFDTLLDIQMSEIPDAVKNLIGGIFLDQAALLGQRTGEMHLALASSNTNPDFKPEAFSKLYQRSLFQSLRSQAVRSLQELEKNVVRLPEDVKEIAKDILDARKPIQNQLKRILDRKISALKIRIHGDYHLGQVLFTGKDFVIIDFEGEPLRSPSERRLKYSCFRDVAGMIRSYHYAVYSVLFQYGTVRPEDFGYLEPWGELWYHYVSGVFLESYLNTVGDSPFIPKEREEIEILLQVFMLNKALYEINYELNNRPDWLVIPLKGIEMVIKDAL